MRLQTTAKISTTLLLTTCLLFSGHLLAQERKASRKKIKPGIYKAQMSLISTNQLSNEYSCSGDDFDAELNIINRRGKATLNNITFNINKKNRYSVEGIQILNNEKVRAISKFKIKFRGNRLRKLKAIITEKIFLNEAKRENRVCKFKLKTKKLEIRTTPVEEAEELVAPTIDD